MAGELSRVTWLCYDPPPSEPESDVRMTTPRPTAVAQRRRQTNRGRRPATVRPPFRIIPSQELDPTDLKNPALYINREMSWLEFNERVLVQARDGSHPLLE